ncbi:ribonuclease H-like domain-containing protein [Tanacetum coccineum]
MIQEGDNMTLWSMKMRRILPSTDIYYTDIITNGDQATTDPASSSAPKTSLAANARRNNEKALNILLSAIPDRHLLSVHDAVDARTLWLAIKARFGGNEASKKMQKEELDSAYERFQHILSMLELYDAKVSQEDANLKFLRSLPSVWHIVATMIRGQPGLDELEFDDLYNNLKVYEHELKGVSNSNSQNIAFLSTEVKGSTLKQSTADPANVPKGYTQDTSSKVQTAPKCASHSDEIICSFFAQQASMPTTHDDEDLLQIDEDAMEEIDIRWQVAMITARIRKFMRKTGRPIDLKPKIYYFDKSKIECFNCQSLCHFARECRFAKNPENRANGLMKKIVLLKIKPKSLVEQMIGAWSLMQNCALGLDGLDWVDSDDEETVLNSSEIQKKTVFNSENSETSFENRSPSSQNSVGQGSRTKGLGNKGNHLGNIDGSQNKAIIGKYSTTSKGPLKAITGGNISTHDDVDDLDAQQFIVHGPNIHAAQNKLSEERTANNEVPLSSEEQALHDELIPDDENPKEGDFSTNSFDAEECTAGIQTRRKLKESTSDQHQALLSFIYKQNRTNHKDQQTCLFACFLSQEEPKKVSQALADESWVEAMQEELLQFKLQELPELKQSDSFWLCIFMALLSIRWMSMSAFYMANITEEGVYVDDIIFGSTKPSMVKDFKDLMQKEFKMSSMGELTFFLGLQVKQTSAGKDEEGEEWKFQVTPKVSHLHAVKRIFSDNAGHHDRRSNFRRMSILGRKTSIFAIKKQTIVAYLLYKAEYVAACKLLCSDCYEQRLINVVKVHTDDNVADLLTKGFDLARFNFLVGLVDPDLIGPWLQQFWATASLRVINDVPHIRAMVAGKKILISEETIRADLLFDDANGVDCFPKQVIWDLLRDIGYEGNLAQLTFSKPLFSPQWKYLRLSINFTCVLSPKSTSWNKLGTNIASALDYTLDSPYVKVVTALAAEEEHSTSPHSRAASFARDAQGTPTQSAAQASISTAQDTAGTQGTTLAQDTAEDQGLLDLYALNREVRRLKKQTLSQAKLIRKLKAKLKKLSKFVQPVVKHHALWVESQNLKKRRKRQRKKHKKKVSSVKLGRNKDEGTLSEEHYVQDDYTADPFFEDVVDKDAAVTPDLERKSDETEEINIEEKKASDVKSGDTEELDLEAVQSTARQSTVTPRTLNFDDEAGPSSPIRPTQNIEPEEQFKVDEVLADISRPRGLSIPGPISSY